jgi:copper(I)-binding protein
MKRYTLALAALLLAASGMAQVKLQVKVQDAWVRSTVASQKVAGAFMQLTAMKDAKLVEVRSPIAGRVEIHEMVMEQDTMKMRAVSSVELPQGKAVALGSGGYHVMLMELKQPVNAGDVVPLTLVFEGRDGARESMDIQAAARALGADAHQHQH